MLRTGQDLKIVNSDARLTHNVHAMAQVNPDFNIGQRQGAGPIIRIFDKPETTRDHSQSVHPEEGGCACDIETVLLLVQREWGFEIKEPASGHLRAEALHEKYGASTQQVTVVAGKPVTVNFSFSSARISYVPGSLKTLATVVVPA